MNQDPDPPVFDLRLPERQTGPVVFASPHRGSFYPPDLLAAARIGGVLLRRSEDAFVDDLFGAAPALGAPLLRALAARAYVDVNREPFELDPAMFEDALPPYAITASPRIAAGLGCIARLVANGEEIHARKLRFAEAQGRIERYYRPYHAALDGLLKATRKRFGSCLLIDCHSMPSVAGPLEHDAGAARVDFVLGDRFGKACDGGLVEKIERVLRGLGYVVARNRPYSGGFVTQHYGRPAEGVQVLQIEINRALYMDETRIERGPGFGALKGDLTTLVAHLAADGAKLLAA